MTALLLLLACPPPPAGPPATDGGATDGGSDTGSTDAGWPWSELAPGGHLDLPVDTGGGDDTGVPLIDADEDGAFVGIDDCDDGDPAIHPGAEEIAGDGLDQDCDGSEVADGVPLSGAATIWDGEQYSQYGWVMEAGADLDGDGRPDLATGAPWDRKPGEAPNSPGVVYAQTLEAGVEGQHDAFAWVPTDPGSSGLGEELSAGPDVNEDGYHDLLVGMYNGWRISTEAGGRAVLFLGPLVGELDADAVGIQLYSSMPEAMFGGGVELIGGWGDQGGAIVVGALGDGRLATGAVYVYRGLPRDGFTDEDADLSILGSESGAATGSRLRSVPGLIAGAHSVLVISESEKDRYADGAGVVHIVNIEGSGTLTLPEAGFELWSDTADSHVCCTESGDLDGDGYPDLLVAGTSDPEVDTRGGRVWLLRGPITTGGELDSLAVATISAERGYEWLGISMAIPGDLDGDTLPDLAISAPRDYYYGNDLPGKVYLFPGTLAGAVSGADAARVLQGEHMGDHAGRGLAGGFDVDGDGWGDLAVGAPGHDAGGSEAGRVYLLTGLAW